MEVETGSITTAVDVLALNTAKRRVHDLLREEASRRGLRFDDLRTGIIIDRGAGTIRFAVQRWNDGMQKPELVEGIALLSLASEEVIYKSKIAGWFVISS